LLCREVKVNLAYRWFCGLSIEDTIPDHSAFSRARNERFRDGDIFRRVFVRVVEACIERPDGVQPDIEVLDVTYPTPQEAIEVCVGNAAGGQTTRSK
jgi:transposase